MLKRIKQTAYSKKGESYIYVCVLVLFISMLVSVVIMYMGLMAQVHKCSECLCHIPRIQLRNHQWKLQNSPACKR